LQIQNTNTTPQFISQRKEIAYKKPEALITDGLPSYRDAFNKEFYALLKKCKKLSAEFYTNTKPRIEHINTIRIGCDMNNNKMKSEW